MKRRGNKKICVLMALICMLLQAQPVYAAENVIDSTVTDNSVAEIPTTESTEENGGQGEQNGETDSGQEPGTEEESKNLIPGALTGLRTTAQSQKKVCVAWNQSENAVSYIVNRRQAGASYQQIAVTDKTSYTDQNVQQGKIYYYNVVPVNQENQEGESASIAFSNNTIVKISSQKYTYAQMQKHMTALKKKYSDYCQMTVIGKSLKGREIYDFSIGNPEAESSILVVGTLHAREYICATVLMREIEYYLSNYNQSIDGIKPSKVLQTTQIHYIVMANPDGVAISQSKNARWKANARGVDLNRNFPARKFVVGGKKGAEGYSGKKALSEPESRAVASLTRHLQNEQNLQGVVNYHAMGQIIYGSCSSKGIYKDTKTMYRIAKKETGYKDAYESSGKSPGGQYREYVMYMLGIPSITIEVGKTWAPCSYTDYEREFQKNKYVVLKIAKALG